MLKRIDHLSFFRTVSEQSVPLPVDFTGIMQKNTGIRDKAHDESLAAIA